MGGLEPKRIHKAATPNTSTPFTKPPSLSHTPSHTLSHTHLWPHAKEDALLELCDQCLQVAPTQPGAEGPNHGRKAACTQPNTTQGSRVMRPLPQHQAPQSACSTCRCAEQCSYGIKSKLLLSANSVASWLTTVCRQIYWRNSHPPALSCRPCTWPLVTL
jgi:hypothetical protein